MPLTESQLARNRVAGAVSMHLAPDRIEHFRSELEYAKARQAITSWTRLTLTQRIELARQLVGDDQDAA